MLLQVHCEFIPHKIISNLRYLWYCLLQALHRECYSTSQYQLKQIESTIWQDSDSNPKSLKHKYLKNLIWSPDLISISFQSIDGSKLLNQIHQRIHPSAAKKSLSAQLNHPDHIRLVCNTVHVHWLFKHSHIDYSN